MSHCIEIIYGGTLDANAVLQSISVTPSTTAGFEDEINMTVERFNGACGAAGTGTAAVAAGATLGTFTINDPVWPATTGDSQFYLVELELDTAVANSFQGAVRADHITAWGRAYPSGSNTANIERRAGYNGGRGRLSGGTTFSVYAVEWGSEWTVQRVTVAGNNGGNGINQPSEYNTAGITAVARDDTFVLASGISDSYRLGAGWEGTVFTLGNGVAQNTTESVVAIGGETAANRKAEVYVHTHPRLTVDYRFGPDGSVASGALVGAHTVDAALVPDTYAGGGVAHTDGRRAPIFTNSSNGTETAYPRPIYWARHTGNTQMTWTRSRTGQPAAYWLQSVDFGGIWR